MKLTKFGILVDKRGLGGKFWGPDFGKSREEGASYGKSLLCWGGGGWGYGYVLEPHIVSWQGSPEETRRLMKPGLPSRKEISKIK